VGGLIVVKTCPECRTEIPEDAEVCRACGRRVEGKTCPGCAELCKPAARICRHCGSRFTAEDGSRLATSQTIRASLLPTLLFRRRFIPQEIHLSPETIVIRTWGFFWLTHTNEEIPWEKIAGYHYRSGWFWDRIEIQTRGQSSNAIGCLSKSNGRRIRSTVEQRKE